MGERYLIDTSAIIKYLNQAFPNNGLVFLDAVLDTECNISVITRIELLAWNPEDDGYLNVIRELINKSNILDISEDIIQDTIKIRKLSRVKLPDSIIAASALANNFTLVADNDVDFKKVQAVGSKFKYLNPMSM